MSDELVRSISYRKVVRVSDVEDYEDDSGSLSLGLLGRTDRLRQWLEQRYFGRYGNHRHDEHRVRYRQFHGQLDHEHTGRHHLSRRQYNRRNDRHHFLDRRNDGDRNYDGLDCRYYRWYRGFHGRNYRRHDASRQRHRNHRRFDRTLGSPRAFQPVTTGGERSPLAPGFGRQLGISRRIRGDFHVPPERVVNDLPLTG